MGTAQVCKGKTERREELLPGVLQGGGKGDWDPGEPIGGQGLVGHMALGIGVGAQ